VIYAQLDQPASRGAEGRDAMPPVAAEVVSLPKGDSMTLRAGTLTSVAVALVGASLGFAANARADVPTHTISADANDPGITTARGPNLVWLADEPVRRVGKLLVFLPSGGANNLPTEFTWIGTEGARLGYHTIVLAYRNEVPINATPPAGCGSGIDAPATPPDCAFHVHEELLDGGGESPVVDIDRANGIDNRLSKLLVYLTATYPEEGWSQFLDTSGAEPAPKWSETVIAGQSLGAGEAFYIAQVHKVYRVATFSGWTDAKHGWVNSEGLTPTDRYFTQIHARDNFFARTCFAYLAIHLVPGCPLAGFETPAVPHDTNPRLVDNREPPFGSRQLVINFEPAPDAPAVNDPFHSSSGRDGWIPKAAGGVTPAPKLLNSWRSILGDSDADTYLDQVDNCPLVANPVQTTNPCRTDAAGAVNGSVPATLALTTGAAAAFGTFAPGVDRTYDAGSTANVISTAGDAALAVSDPSATAPGRLVNGAFSLAEPLQASAGAPFAPVGTSPLTLLTYAAPVSNGAVAIAFRQHIGSTQALRTGAYTKTLTFTLSTTTP
jgi:hypothetical protein